MCINLIDFDRGDWMTDNSELEPGTLSAEVLKEMMALLILVCNHCIEQI